MKTIKCQVCDKRFPWTRNGYSEFKEHLAQKDIEHLLHPLDELNRLSGDIFTRALELFAEHHGNDAEL